MDKNSVSVGEYIQITSCSEGASSYFYDFGNGGTSVKEHPEVLLMEAGEFTIVLTVKDAEDNTDTFSRSLTVTEPIEVNYIFPEIPLGFSGMPLETGLNPLNNNIYYIESREDKAGPEGNKFYYHELDENYSATTNYIADRPFQSGSAFVNLLPSGNRNFHFSRTLPDFYGTQEVTLTDTWGFVSGINAATKHSYGYLPDGSNFLYFGTQKEDGIQKTAIERRNASGDAFETYFNALGDADSMIGDLISIGSGYIAYGIVFSKNAVAPYVTDYKPALIFFDAGLNITSHKIFEDSALTNLPMDINDLNGPYHLEQLSNGNLVFYGNGEVTVTDSTGNKITSTIFSGTDHVQALISLGDSFVLSTNDYLKKFDQNGNQTKELKYNGHCIPEFITINNKLFFVAGYNTLDTVDGVGDMSVSKLFYGATDMDLNPINLNL